MRIFKNSIEIPLQTYSNSFDRQYINYISKNSATLFPISNSSSSNPAFLTHQLSSLPTLSPSPNRLSKLKRRIPHDQTLRREVIDVPFVESSPRGVLVARRAPLGALESLKWLDTLSETGTSRATRANSPRCT